MDTALLIRAALSFCLVLGLIGLFALALRKWGSRLARVAPRGEARISVVEALGIGPKHRLVLVKRDQAEHLLLLTPESAVVVERGIARNDENLD